MKPSLNEYIDLKLDNIKGEIPRLKHMLKKSFTAPSFRVFWTVWKKI